MENIENFLSYGKQWLDDDDISGIVETLKSDFLTQGPKIKEFEDKICEYTGAKYCVVVANATAGLHIAVKSLKITKGMEGITSPNTFLASSNCLVYNELFPVFADIDNKTYNISLKEIEKRITRKTKVIIPVHFAGRAVDIEKLYNLTKEKEIFVIEDAAHAIGSLYQDGSKVGCCKYSDMTVFSFHPVKTITTGEGGAITTNNEVLYKKLLELRSHGMTKDTNILSANPGPWYYEMVDLGFNYRLTDIGASLGITQLRKLEQFKKRRKEIVDLYNSAFNSLDWLTTPYDDKKLDTCFHLYVLQIDYNKIGKSRNNVMEILKSKNIGTQVHYIPVHTQPFYKVNFGYRYGDYPISENYYDRALSIPLYPKMSDHEVQYVIKNILELGK